MGDLLAKMADLHQVRVRAFIDEPEMGGLEPGLPVENYLGRTGEPDLGGTDGNHTEAGCLTLLAQRWRTAVLGGKRQLELLYRIPM